MQYEFSIGSFFLGLLILGAGIAFALWYQVIADNMGNGVSSYDRYRLAALITCGIGLVVIANLHIVLLKWIVGLIFPHSL
jgi:hypothetical protein